MVNQKDEKLKEELMEFANEILLLLAEEVE